VRRPERLETEHGANSPLDKPVIGMPHHRFNNIVQVFALPDFYTLVFTKSLLDAVSEADAAKFATEPASGAPSAADFDVSSPWIVRAGSNLSNQPPLCES